MNQPSENSVDATISAIKNWQNIDLNSKKACNLLRDGIIVYGATCDEGIIPYLVGFYDVCTQFLSENDRYEIYHQVNALLMDGKISTNALFPILFREPNGGIASSATIDYVQLTTHHESDTFYSVNNIASWIISANVANKAALLAGLVNLGDTRISSIIDGLRDRISTHEAKDLGSLTNGYPTVGAFEFWLRWLETAPDKTNSNDNLFEIIAAGLARLILDKKIEHFSNVERHYGYRPFLNEPSMTIIEEISSEEIGNRYAERLFALEASEPPPKIMSIILQLYGLRPRAPENERMVL